MWMKLRNITAAQFIDHYLRQPGKPQSYTHFSLILRNNTVGACYEIVNFQIFKFPWTIKELFGNMEIKINPIEHNAL